MLISVNKTSELISQKYLQCRVNMAEDVKIKGTDKPIQSSESFTLESLQLIQIRDFDHSVQAIHLQNQFKRVIHFRISTSLVMILKSVDGWNQACQNSETVQLLGYDWQVWSAPIRSHIANHLIQIGISELGSQIFVLRSELRSGFVNFFIQIGSLQRVCTSFCELIDLQSTLRSPTLKWWFGNHYSDYYSEAWITNHLIPIGTLRSTLRSPDMKWYGSWIISPIETTERSIADFFFDY